MALADGVRRLREALDTQLPQMHAALQERRAAAQGARSRRRTRMRRWSAERPSFVR